ncbi:MAG: PEP-CTERM sorting domain-containing protein [Pirellulales bacterium]
MISASQLTSFQVGSVINGLQFRKDLNGPAQNVSQSWTNYDVMLAQPAAGLTLTSFGTTNGIGSIYLQNPVMVRSGPLTIAANSYIAGGANGPSPFGTPIQFNTGYVYQGGDLMVFISHSTGTGFVSLDVTTESLYGFGTPGAVYAQRFSTSYNPSVGPATATGAPIIALTVPEPTTVALMGFGMVGVAGYWIRRRRLGKLALEQKIARR